MGGFRIWHVLIVAVSLLLLFSGNRFSAMMGDVASGVRSVKAGLAEDGSQAGAPNEHAGSSPSSHSPPVLEGVASRNDGEQRGLGR